MASGQVASQITKTATPARDTLSRILAEMCRPGKLFIVRFNSPQWKFSPFPPSSDHLFVTHLTPTLLPFLTGVLERPEDHHELGDFVDNEGRTYTGERFNKFVRELERRVSALLSSQDPLERLAGIVATDELAFTAVYGESPNRLAELVTMLEEDFFQRCSGVEPYILEIGARTLGHLVRVGGTLMADKVDLSIANSISLLQLPTSLENHRLARVLVLKELAEAAPAVFNVHVKDFIVVIWTSIRDSKQHVREAAVAALQACLQLVEMRETRYRVQWYYRLFEETQDGLAQNESLESIHGSLMVLGQLLAHTGEFMLARYREVCEKVLSFRNHKEKLIRGAIVTLIPRLASFAPERFVKSYLQESTEHLLSVLSNSPAERAAAFQALGEMATALSRAGVASRMKSPKDYLQPIALQIREALATTSPAALAAAAGSGGRGGAGGGTNAINKMICAESLRCTGILAVALRLDWQPYAESLLEPMFHAGLSQSLVAALRHIVGALPDLLPKVQEILLDLLSLVLARRPFTPNKPAHAVMALQNALHAGELQGIPLLRLALHTLGSFDLTSHPLLDFTKDHVVPYLDDNDASIRRCAALAACHIVEQSVHYTNAARRQLPMNGRSSTIIAQRRAVDKIIQRLLAAAVADPAVSVRKGLLSALAKTTSLDGHLAQGESLRSLFIALNDESATVRMQAIELAGHLSTVNPAYVMPALRKHLMQLLCDMDLSPDSKQREDSARLLGVLIKATPSLVLPYTSAILKALLSKLRAAGPSNQGMVNGGGAGGGGGGRGGSGGGGGGRGGEMTSNSTVAAKTASGVQQEDGFHLAVLITLGELAKVAGIALRPSSSEILPLVIDALGEVGGASYAKRLAAVRTLAQVVESTGMVVTPYQQYPQLLGIMLRMLNEGSPAAKRDVMRAIGTIGALDPHAHKGLLAEMQGEGKLEREGVRPQFPPSRHGGGGGGGGGGAHGSEAYGLGAGGGGDGGGGGGTTLPGGGGDSSMELLPSIGLVTSSDEYYPTVAINALMRVLRDPTAVALHGKAVKALFRILEAMGLNFVPFLPKVVPVLLQLTRSADDRNRRKELLSVLRKLVALMKQHIRRFLPDFLLLIRDFWIEDTQYNQSSLLPDILKLLATLGATLRDDFRHHIPELLPRFVSLFAEAERTGEYQLVEPGLVAIRALGLVLEDHLQLLLPALVRLIAPSAGSPGGIPLYVAQNTLLAMQDLLPTMQLAGQASAVLHPLMRLLDNGPEELRELALDTLCSVALAVGPEFAVFVPTVKKVILRRKMQPNASFARVAAGLLHPEPPCLSEASDWETSTSFLAAEHLPKPKIHGWADVLEEVASTPTEYGTDSTHGGLDRIGITKLQGAWESSQRSTREDWAEWMRNFSVELLKQSPSKALRACAALAQASPGMARDLFAAGFVSCWSELDDENQDRLVRSLEAALASPSIPPDIVTTLLNLAEFMEHDEKALPLDTRTLGALAEKCHAYAKALHYKELEFETSPLTAAEALISINNQLRQPDAAEGILKLAETQLGITLREGVYEKLQRWEEARNMYEAKLMTTMPGSQAHADALLGECRCLAALAEWDELFILCRREWTRTEPQTRREMAPIASHAAWQLGDWNQMKSWVDHCGSGSVSSNNSEGAFLSAVIETKQGRYDNASADVQRARELLGAELAALVGESYERAYANMVRVQQLTELEEILAVRRSEGISQEAGAAARQLTQEMWAGRLQGVQRSAEVWQALLSIRRLMLEMHEDAKTWIKFSRLCRETGRPRQSAATLTRLLEDVRKDVNCRQLGAYDTGNPEPWVLYAWYKHQWATNNQGEAYGGVQHLAQELEAAVAAETAAVAAAMASQDSATSPLATSPYAPGSSRIGSHQLQSGALLSPSVSGIVLPMHSTSGTGTGGVPPDNERLLLTAKANHKVATWRRQLTRELSPDSITSIMSALKAATGYAPGWEKAWHSWAYFNCEALAYYNAAGDVEVAQQFVAPAVTGFFRSIELGQTRSKKKAGHLVRSNNLQDILRLLTLWFNYGNTPEVESALQEGFGQVSIDTWLSVIPQLLARIHVNIPAVKRLIHEVLVRVGRQHPQALMYPLLVACKSQSAARRGAADAIVEDVRQHSPTLVEQAQLVSGEMIQMAILWHEMWHEALEEASRLYFGESNVEGMLRTLLPLHEMMRERGANTLKEIAFLQAYGRELDEAYDWCLRYQISRKEAELHQAWDLYYHVFKRINKQLPSLTTLELQYVAPALVRAQGLELAVPGTYIAGEPLVTIAAFAPQLHVITSKQRPRKLTIHGSDGADYMFLLKGHEDLRQDERVMQLFGLVNNMLAADRNTAERDLSIARYAVIPLSPNSGLIGWVPNTDTLHALIREYRDARKIPLNVEHRLMLGMAPDYDGLTVIQKVEVFEHALDSTSGEDLHRVLWLKSRSSEAWLDKRTQYTRSTAVMSMVGYILGLGDRHPSNLMLDRYSGKLLHIDFGDCFEASMHREKFPEKVPFRLTRMMVKAMEVCGIGGNFKATCNEVMRVLRENKDDVMAMLEAFVHDPLINWRLLNADTVHPDPQLPVVPGVVAGDGSEASASTATTAAASAAEGFPVTGDIGAAVGTVEAAMGGAGGAAQENEIPSPPRREATREKIMAAYGAAAGDANAELNDRAVQVMKRMGDKLTGRDAIIDGAPGNVNNAENVEKQVKRLIEQAMNHENLCQLYVGWCGFW